MRKETGVRPWGSFERFTHNEISTVKILTIKPKKKNSLQYHNKRKEFWRVLEGNPILTIGKKVEKAKPGNEFSISKKTEHRIESGDKQVKILEISFGEFDEEDIVRLEDDFGRV